MKVIYDKGAVVVPEGFLANALKSGIKTNGYDLALIAVKEKFDCVGVGTFTKNEAKAHPVLISLENLKNSKNKVRAVFINSGNANALNGAKGYRSLLRVLNKLAAKLGIDASQILPLSTGLIGTEYPEEKVKKSIEDLVGGLSSEKEQAELAAKAILTTDTKEKCGLYVGSGFKIGALAKGAAMLSPNMATMLSVITTDAKFTPSFLNLALKEAVNNSFNLINVDNSTSTNDSVILLSSMAKSNCSKKEFLDALTMVCKRLAYQMVKDAEGASKCVKLRILNAQNEKQAFALYKKVSSSMLVKCSLFGNDPYWGRILSELGSAQAGINLSTLRIYYDSHLVFKNGEPVVKNMEEAKNTMKKDEFVITCDLSLGDSQLEGYMCDLGFDYIKENMKTS